MPRPALGGAESGALCLMVEAACEVVSAWEVCLSHRTSHCVEGNRLIKSGAWARAGLGLGALTFQSSLELTAFFSLLAGRLRRVPHTSERLLPIPFGIPTRVPASLLPGSPTERKCPHQRSPLLLVQNL